MARAFICLFFLACFMGLTPFVCPGEDIVEKKAQQSMDIMNYKMAISGFEQVLSKDPHRKGIRTKLAFCHFRQEEIDKAIELLNEELIHFPDDLEALILLGYCHYRQENFEDALKAFHRYIPVFEEFIKKERKSVGQKYGLTKENAKVLLLKLRQENPNYGLPHFILGLEQKKRGVYDRAKNYFEQAIQAGYDPLACYCHLIDIELAQDNWTQALVRARRAQQAAGMEAEFYFLIGYAYEGYGREKYAVSSFKKSLELKPYLVEAIKNLGIIAYNQGQFEESQQYFERVLKLVPYDYETKFLLERAEKKQLIRGEGKGPELTKAIIEEMKPEFKHRIESDLDFVLDTMTRSVSSLIRLGELDSAIGLINRFLEVNDHKPGLDYNLALVYNMKNENLKALRHAWIAATIKKNFRDAHDLIGNIYFKMEEYDHAIHAYKDVVSIDKTDAMGYYNLGCAYAAIGDEAKAEENWKRAIHYEVIEDDDVQSEISGDELSASLFVVGRRVVFHSHMSLGQLYVAQKKWNEALEQFQNALEVDADQSEPHYELGKIYMEKGDATRAREHFEKYLYLGGEKEKEVQDLLDKIKGGA